MVSSTTRKIISLAISLLVVVISLTGVALGATTPAVSSPTRYTPGFKGAPGKMARDMAGNFYVTDFWGKQIVKLDSNLANPVYLPTSGRPSAVAALADGRLVVAMAKPTPKVVFYSPVNASEVSFAAPAYPLFNPNAVTVDASGNIYVLDSGNSSSDAVVVDPNFGRVRVYSSSGAYLYYFGTRTTSNSNFSVGGNFKLPAGIAYEKEANQVVVVDTLNGMLQYFTAWNNVSCDFVKAIGGTAGRTAASIGGSVTFYNPVDIAFEYSGTALYRAYVPQRGTNEVAVVDTDTAGGAYGTYLSVINGSTVTGADLKLPNAVSFEKTATGGVLYVGSDATSTAAANILKLSVAGGSVPPQTVAMTMSTVPPTSPSSPISVTVTTSPANPVTCTVNGSGTGVVITGGPATWNASLPLTSGNNHILCKSTLGGVTSFKEADTFLGALPPDSVGITLPAAGLYTNATSVTVSGTTGSANASVQLTNSLGGTVTAQSDASKNWSAVVNLLEGSNAITATAWKTGTTSASPTASVTVVADYTPPNMTGTVSFLNSGAVTNNAIQNIDGIVLDANLASVQVSVNGVTSVNVNVPSSSTVALGGNNTYFSAPVTLVRGSNTITVKATDKANNSTTFTRTVTLKPEAVGIAVALPADNSYMSAPGSVTASGASDAGLTSVNAAGTVVTPASGSWSTAAMNVTAGFGSYQFVASGAGLDTVTVKRTINTNATYQQVAITSPASDIATSATSFAISGTVPANSTIPQISINGAAAVNVGNYTLISGAFSHTVALAQGLNTVKIVSANGTTAVRNIILDTTAPDLGMQADSAPAPTIITGSLEPSAKLTAITANPGNVSIPLSIVTFDTYDGSGTVIWHANLSGYSYSTVDFTAADPAGNTTKLSYKKGIPTGDIDGDGVVRLADALAALRHVAGTDIIADPDKFFNGDVGGLINGRVARDGLIDIQDSVLILNKAYGLMNF
ncbi:MAG: SMP-30/gluconolactonase/LRE family protein [Geobacteraceae bacterium]|nr:SMP-30/gluconolactonase/LRE family protein [Geobacteraceae bacterium]